MQHLIATLLRLSAALWRSCSGRLAAGTALSHS